ncbi:transposase [Candidatus Filomicrobium marinum]|uniref:Transposase n=1 Tax=Candidatus Filomicrobium marinum TaxID=1608628 RepID=A0A0D6JBQ6_9HYPH|nr:IS1595 family transposase [Candidatus Filomicrobium marinum]CFX06820.1 transposase [Candidatus Filomicrobium marinum]CPR16499.1 transposase [Candidatus Filomicrobium marinum]
MATNFKLTARARTLSLREVFTMGEDKAYDLFRQLRWPETDGAAVCPKCGHDKAYEITTRRKFKCKACHHQFSVTSGTIFASRKLSFTDILAAIAIIVDAAKGVSAMQLSRDLDVQHKTAWILAHKLREAMASETASHTLSGVVEVDGAYFGGHVKPANKKTDRKDRRLSENQTGKRRVVVVARQRQGRTLPFVHEHESDGVETVSKVIDNGSTVHADEASHWDALHATFPTLRINHSEAFSLNGVCTNQAESYFSRLRRMVRGQHHHVSARYLAAYAQHAAWMEDHREMDNAAMAKRVIGLAMGHSVSRNWKGYWQRTKV